MGYTTDFHGSFKINKALDTETKAIVDGLSTTRRMARNVGKEFGVEGEFYFDNSGNYGQNRTSDIIDYNRPPKTQPGLWCQWQTNELGTIIEWDGNEKFYNYVEWLEYLINKVLAPKGYKLNGEVEWTGEDRGDMGLIKVTNNKVSVKRAKISYR